jgi:Mn-dependent DtxR family transcriptional regulator
MTTLNYRGAIVTPKGLNMSTERHKILTSFFQSLENMESDDMMGMVEKYLKDEDVEIFVNHIETFYGITDDEELGMLAQLMVTGFLAAKHEESLKASQH